MKQLFPVATLLLALALPARAVEAPVPGERLPTLVFTTALAEQVVFDPRRDACDGHDVPDVPPRAYRDAQGNIRLFTLHYENRALIGPDFDSLRINCKVVFRGQQTADPAAYDDKSWITATWTRDGKTIHGLAHHEFQANAHEGRCVYREYMPCWYNTILAIRSTDGGETFTKPPAPVVASSPFPQNIGQGRHRGFFNPSNIVSDGVWHYMIASTTGWSGQAGGACLFRTDNIADPARWRAFDGTDFTVKFEDPYRGKPDPKKTCAPVGPFPAPVGSITKHRGSGLWVAVFQAKADGRQFPVSGIYIATSRNLKVWGAPSRLIATKTLYDDAAGAEMLRSYPVLIDRAATTRNFEDIGDTPELYLSRMRVEKGKHTSDRALVRLKVEIAVK